MTKDFPAYRTFREAGFLSEGKRGGHKLFDVHASDNGRTPNVDQGRNPICVRSAGVEPIPGMDFKDRIRQRLDELGLNHAEASRRAGRSVTYVRDLLERTASPKAHHLEGLAKALKTNSTWILTGRNEAETVRTVPIVGYVGARAVIYAINDHAKGAGLDEVEAPPGAPEGTVAVVVRGKSMLPAYRDGYLIFYSQHLPAEDLIGEDAVVALADGTRMLKRVMHGSGPGLFTLDSSNDEPLVDVRLEWAAPIDWIKPRRR